MALWTNFHIWMEISFILKIFFLSFIDLFYQIFYLNHKGMSSLKVSDEKKNLDIIYNHLKSRQSKLHMKHDKKNKLINRPFLKFY